MPETRVAMPRSLTESIAVFAAQTPSGALQGTARDILKLSLLDWTSVGLAGVTEPVSRMIAAMVLAEGGVPEATVLGLSHKLPARAAALVNGTTSHALDYDDTHFDYIGHPSVAIFPAALALAQKTGASGAAFLDAALVGMETACRVGRWLGMSHYQHGFHQTATAGCFGATAAAARLLGLDVERTAHALGLAATRASGLKSQFGTMGKPYNAGIAASNGVETALLAAHGFVSRPDGIECIQGFGETHAGEVRDLDVVLAGLGEVFRFEDVQHKFHACCHGTHPTLEALLTARNDHEFRADDVSGVTLTVAPKWLRVCDIQSPRTGLEAKFSYRLTSAMALAGYDTGALTSFTDALCHEPRLTGLRDRVRVETDGALKDTAAAVSIALTSGRRIDAHHDLDLPVPIDVKRTKILTKARGLVGGQMAERLHATIGLLEQNAVQGFALLLEGEPADA